MNDPTIMPPQTCAMTLAYLRSRGVPGAFEYIPDVMLLAGSTLGTGETLIEIVDQDELGHTFCAPGFVGRGLIAGEQWAMTRVRRVLRAEWN